ncbi:uncharacterized protein [Miscanthus floridulus]|uniref:uncharacterized protein n=1 Tax=Miscanthus floridulus TaxID=154761 RepID=UPI003457CB2B
MPTTYRFSHPQLPRDAFPRCSTSMPRPPTPPPSRPAVAASNAATVRASVPSPPGAEDPPFRAPFSASLHPIAPQPPPVHAAWLPWPSSGHGHHCPARTLLPAYACHRCAATRSRMHRAATRLAGAAAAGVLATTARTCKLLGAGSGLAAASPRSRGLLCTHRRVFRRRRAFPAGIDRRPVLLCSVLCFWEGEKVRK